LEEALAEIRQLGLRVESEKIDAQDVTRRYVDQDASLRKSAFRGVAAARDSEAGGVL